MNDNQKNIIEKALAEMDALLADLETKTDQKAKKVGQLKQTARDSIEKIDLLVKSLKKAE